MTASGGLSPQTPYQGFASGPHMGLPPPNPLVLFAPHHRNTYNASVGKCFRVSNNARSTVISATGVNELQGGLPSKHATCPHKFPPSHCTAHWRLRLKLKDELGALIGVTPLRLILPWCFVLWRVSPSRIRLFFGSPSTFKVVVFAGHRREVFPRRQFGVRCCHTKAGIAIPRRWKYLEAGWNDGFGLDGWKQSKTLTASLVS